MKKVSTFFEREKRQRILLIALFVIFLIGIFVWFRYFKPEFFSFPLPKIEISSPEVEKLKLILELLENSKLKNLEPFPQIEPPKPEEVGRGNPFSSPSLP